MTTATGEPAAQVRLRTMAADLRSLLGQSDHEIQGLGHDFEDLARQTRSILESARVTVECAENDRTASVLPAVRKLGSAAQEFIRQRLQAAAEVLDTVVAEEALLGQLAQLTRGQKAIVRETSMLRVLTNIEVARLGEVGNGFRYLAHELDDFSQSVARSTDELMEHTDGRRKAVEETRRTLAAELPEMREGFARIEQNLDHALGEVDASLAALRQTPLRFSACVEEVASKIAGVVAAIQAYDITRQQIEHVEGALDLIAGMMETGEYAKQCEAQAGLTVQIYQLRNIRQTIDGWMTQIRSCLEGIARIASSDLLSLGEIVTGQEASLSRQLTRIERLESDCEASDSRVQSSFAGMTGLMQLVGEHLDRSKSVRDRLQLLMFNSIVEASHLGSRAAGIMEISTTIKRISATWSEITTRAEAATGQIRTLADASHNMLEAFSEGSYAALRETQAETEIHLESLRQAVSCAESHGRSIESAVTSLRGRIREIGAAGDRLEACSARIEPTLEAIESVRRQITESGRCGEAFDAGAAEKRFSAAYTTEVEREILRAALTGGPMPEAQQSFAGNSVELF